MQVIIISRIRLYDSTLNPAVLNQMNKMFLLKMTIVFFIPPAAITKMSQLMNILSEKHFRTYFLGYLQRKNLRIHHHCLKISRYIHFFRKDNPGQFPCHMQSNPGTYRHQLINTGSFRKILFHNFQCPGKISPPIAVQDILIVYFFNFIPGHII